MSPSFTEAFANASKLTTSKLDTNSTNFGRAAPGGIVRDPKTASASRTINQVFIGIYCLANDNSN